MPDPDHNLSRVLATRLRESEASRVRERAEREGISVSGFARRALLHAVRGVAVSPAAVLLGACVIERHFTLDRTMKGPDHAASVEPPGMSLIVRRARNLHISLGSPKKTILESELANRKKFRGY